MARKDSDDFFKEQFNQFGATPQGLNWGSKESQEARFSIINEYIENGMIVVDVGCGFGDFYSFCDKDIQYIGVDSVEEMIESAKNSFPKAKFINKNFLTDELPEADLYMASGSLNLLTYDETYQAIKKCFQNSKKAFIFNILSTHSDYFTKGYNYFSPSEMLAYCMSLTKKVILRHDYMPHDFTIVMYK